MAAIIISDAAIVARAVYRVIELAQGWRGHLITTEYYFYVLDTAPMIICMGIWIVGHPGLTLDNEVVQSSFRSGSKRKKSSRDSGETISLDQVQLNIAGSDIERSRNMI